MSAKKIEIPSVQSIPDDRVYHLCLREGDIPGYVILHNDPDSILKRTGSWDDTEELAYNREYRTIRGIYKGVPLAAVSTGIGCQSCEICINELRRIGAHSCIRVGTAGSIDENIGIGDLIIPAACMRKGGTSVCYVDPEFPAFADLAIVKALMVSCEKLGFRYSLGVAYSASSFYLGQGRALNEDGTGYRPSWLDKLLPDLKSARISCIDMDTAGQFIVGYLQGMRMGAVLAITENRLTNSTGDNGGMDKAFSVAFEAAKLLTEWDAGKETDRKINRR